MSIPRQVQKAGERANQLLDRFAEAKTQGTPGEETQTPGTPGSEADTQTQAPPPEPPATAEQEPAKPSQPSSNDDDRSVAYWKDRFSVLQGKYNAEVPRLQRRVKELEARIQELESQPPAASQPSARLNGDLFTPEEREEYGDLLPIIERVASRIADRTVQPVQQTIQSRQEHDQKAAEQRYWADLYRLVDGDPLKINDDPGFQAWLAEVDPLTGRMRDAFLQEAHQQLDAHRVAAFFNEWVRSQGAAQRPAKSTPPDLPPDSRSSAAPSNAQHGRIWTRQAIKQFYADSAAGKYRGREDERAAIERDIMAAQQEGRIRH